MVPAVTRKRAVLVTGDEVIGSAEWKQAHTVRPYTEVRPLDGLVITPPYLAEVPESLGMDV